MYNNGFLRFFAFLFSFSTVMFYSLGVVFWGLMDHQFMENTEYTDHSHHYPTARFYKGLGTN